MTNTEKKISEMIEQAEVVADPLEKLVEKAKTDPGAPFEPDPARRLSPRYSPVSRICKSGMGLSSKGYEPS